MSELDARPTVARRIAAALSLLVVAAVIVSTVIAVVRHPIALIAELALLLIAAVAAWEALRRVRQGRWISLVVVGAAFIGVVATEIADGGQDTMSLVVRIAMLVVAVGLARYALSLDVRTLKTVQTPGTPVPPAEHGALIMNLKSGGGKAERFHLEDECRKRGIEPIVLRQGDDLATLARDAIDRGADVIGMAGGDGSQALVADVAAERDVPMVVIPAGTRNHLALDLGLDRDDVVGALDAYGEALERAMDLGDVNGRVFVNNVSLGLYAEIVASPEYRDAKRDTTLAALPEMIGPYAEPFDFRFTTPDGRGHDGAHVIQVSNNPYGTTVAGRMARPRLDTGLLGIFCVLVPDSASALRAAAAFAAQRPDAYDGYLSWSAPRFEVASGAPIATGLDGESIELEPPLIFTSRPQAVRVRLAPSAIGHSPAARAVPAAQLLPALWNALLGRTRR